MILDEKSTLLEAIEEERASGTPLEILILRVADELS